MPKVFMYIPFSKQLLTGGEDGYFTGMITAFKNAGHPADHLIFAKAELTWSTTKPTGEEAFVTPIVGSEGVKTAWAREAHAATTPGTDYYLTAVLSARQRALSEVGVDDMLFMVGHSGPTGGYLVLKRTRKEGEVSMLDKYKIRVDALARLLVADGLNRGHRHIKLNSCYGGGSIDLDRALAGDLAKQLRKLHFARAEVGGYQYAAIVTNGAVSIQAPTVTTKPRTAPDYSLGMMAPLTDCFSVRNNPSAPELMYERDPYRCWYSGSGTCLRWNVPPAYYDIQSEVNAAEPSARRGAPPPKMVTQTVALLPLLAKDDGPQWAAYEKKKSDERSWIKRLGRLGK